MDKLIKSSSAIIDCMNKNRIGDRGVYHHKVLCKIIKSGRLQPGVTGVTFINSPSGNDHPYLLFDDTIKGYGLSHTEYRPEYQVFSFDNIKNELMIKGRGYAFTIKDFTDDES